MMLSRTVRGLLCLTLAAAGLPAQLVWPAAYAATPGNAVLNAPFTSRPGHPTATTRCTVVIDAASLPFGPGTTLTQLALRRDTAYATQAYATVTGALRVRIGRAVAPPDQVQDVRFHRLWNGPPTQVFNVTSATPFTVPPGPAPGASLPPFNVVIPFTTTFLYTGGPLGIEMTFTPNPGSSLWRVDGFAVPEPSNGTFRKLGNGCAGSNAFTPFHYAFPETAVPGGNLTVQMEGAVRPAAPGTLQDFAMHIVGLSGTTIGGVLPLPIDLAGILGTPVGCMLRVDPLLSNLVFCTNPSLLYNRAIGTVLIPNNGALAGANVYSQWMCFDYGVSAPFKATMSDGIEITLGSVPPSILPRQARTVWKYGATPFVNEIDSGRMVPNGYGPILRFN